MPLPTINDVQAVDPVLTNMLVSYMQDDSRFVADKVFPIVPVDKDSGTYYIFDKKYWFTDGLEPRVPGDAYAKGLMGVSTDTFTTAQFAKAIPIADEVRRNSQVPMDLETAAVQMLAGQIMIRRERAFSAAWMITGVWGTTKSVTSKWSDYSASDPAGDILLGMDTISDSTGKEANALVMGKIVRSALVNHPDMIDRIKYNQSATMGNVENALASILGVAYFLVSKASYNTANLGQSASNSAIVDDDALLCHVDPAAGLFGASAGKTFVWAPGGGQGMIDMVRMDENDADLIKSKTQFVHKAVATDMGYFFLDVTD